MQPDFQFPVVGFPKVVARNAPNDDGVRTFAEPKDLSPAWFDVEIDLRTGMMLIDATGRCWEIVSARNAGPYGGAFQRLFQPISRSPKYRIEHEFAEREPMSFDEVKTRWHAALKANPMPRSVGHSELKAAQKLSDLIKTDDEWATEAHRPDSLDWMTFGGRSSRAQFILVATLGLACAVVPLLARGLPQAVKVLGLLLGFCAGVIVVFRRLHDIRRTGAWAAGFWLAVMGGADLIQRVIQLPDAFAEIAWTLWFVPFGAGFLYLAVKPGDPAANRYGPAPR